MREAGQGGEGACTPAEAHGPCSCLYIVMSSSRMPLTQLLLRRGLCRVQEGTGGAAAEGFRLPSEHDALLSLCPPCIG